MKNYKYRVETFSPFDFRRAEEHLSAMAAKGWRLESIGRFRFFWKYRRAEPAKVHYAVTCPPAAEENGDLRERLYFEELCAAAGWEKAADWEQMQIYANEAPDPTPLETDESIRLETIHQSMRRTHLADHRRDLIFDLILLVSCFCNMRVGLHTSLLSNIILCVPLLMLLAVLMDVLYIAGYFSWYRRSLRSVEEGGDLAGVPRFYRIVNRMPVVTLILLVLILIPLEFTTRNTRNGLHLAAVVIGSVLGVGLGWVVKRFSDKRGWDGYTRAAAVILSLLALLAVLAGLANWLNLSERLRLSGPETPSYTWDGQEWDLEPQPLPLTVEDLTGQPWAHVRRTARTEGRTLLASETVCTEAAAREDGTKAGLVYRITDVPNDRLRRAVLEDIRTGPSFLEYRPEDPGPWNAEEVYRLDYPDGRTANEWLLSWPGRIAAVSVEDLALTPEQKAVISARLSPEDWKEETR